MLQINQKLQAQAECSPDSAVSTGDDNELEDPLPWPSQMLYAAQELMRFSKTKNSKEWDEARDLLPKIIRSLRSDVQNSLVQSTLSFN